jgi:hypothetical protein
VPRCMAATRRALPGRGERHTSGHASTAARRRRKIKKGLATLL